MAETINLALDVTDQKGRTRVARIYLEQACSYTKAQGAPTLTGDCDSVVDLEREIERLKEELDLLLDRARSALGDGPQRNDRPKEVPRHAAGLAGSSGKIPVRVTDDLCVADEMTTNVKTMYRNDHLSVADELMKTGGFRHVVVVDEEDAVVGVVSHRDIFYGALAWSCGQGEVAHRKLLDALPAKQVMSTDVTTVAPDLPLVDAARLMSEKKLGCLPVVGNGKLVGILTEADFLSMLTQAGQPTLEVQQDS